MVSFERLYEQRWRGAPERRDELRVSVLKRLADELGARAGLPAASLGSSRLASGAAELDAELGTELVLWTLADDSRERLTLAHRLGQTLDALLALEAAFERSESHASRKNSGSFFTPPEIARVVIDTSLPLLPFGAARDRVTLRICDPAEGGGAFLLEVARALVEQGRAEGVGPGLRRAIHECLYGFDKMALACAVSEVALWLYLGDGELRANPRLVHCDSLAEAASAWVPEGGFDWIVGNPPWVAFQGRAARPLPREQRAYYRHRYRAFRGYPTLQSLFIERAAEWAPSGLISLLVPSSLSDLDGYRALRTRLTESHRPAEPLQEFGQDAFSGVVQPCFALIARPLPATQSGDARPWKLSERARKSNESTELVVPGALLRLASLPTLPPELFRELGLQTNRQVTAELLRRAAAPKAPYVLGLLEGRRVQEFVCHEPELFLHPHQPTLERTKCLLRPPSTYQAVSFVVRQTAAFPIAAAHNGHTFRNSLLGGFVTEEFDRDLLLGLLNSALYRAFHVAGQRDARQATFPQVKLSHLRKLPRPPADARLRQEVRRLSARATNARSLDPQHRTELDAAVFALFGIDAVEQEILLDYLRQRCPGALSVPRPRGAGRGAG